jgi:predicted acylesterase/phospholipase RssA
LPSIGIAISGGGHRAGLFGLGVLLYLADAGKNRHVACVSSVSGGSLTNGYVAQAVGYADADAAEFRTATAPLARRLARTGTFFPPSLFTWAYLLVLLALLAALVLVWWAPWAIAVRTGAFVLGILAFFGFADARGLVCSRALARTLYSPTGRFTRLEELHDRVQHVICATDLHAGEHVYFSRRFVCSYRFGWGRPADLPLHVAVQCSAALPGAFPPRWLPVARHGFTDGQPEAAGTTRMALVDGGVYDNMADQWMIGLAERRRHWPSHADAMREPEEIVIANASAGLRWGSVKRLRFPVVGEIAALLRDKTVLYDNGNTVRRRLALERFKSGQLRGAMVDIARSPLDLADSFATGTDDAAARARAVIALLEPERAAWREIADHDARMATTLWGFSGTAGARLLRHAYVLAMANLHVLLDYPLLAVPAQATFEELVG